MKNSTLILIAIIFLLVLYGFLAIVIVYYPHLVDILRIVALLGNLILFILVYASGKGARF